MILGSPLNIRLKLHYLVRKRFFSAQNSGRNEIFIVRNRLLYFIAHTAGIRAGVPVLASPSVPAGAGLGGGGHLGQGRA